MNNYNIVEITYFHRNQRSGYSINKVSQTYIREIEKKYKVEQFYVPCNRADPVSCLRNIIFVYRHRNKNKLNHITGGISYCILALIKCKTILTIHDTYSIICEKNKIKKIIYKILWYKIPLKKATKIVCISGNTKLEILKIFKRLDIRIIYNAIDQLFKPINKEFNKESPVILHFGTGWGKNLENTIYALYSINCHLNIIGVITEEQKNILQKGNVDYSVKTNLTDDEIINEYNNCDIVSICSYIEGFGMPIIEAQAVGRAVITSKIEPMTEVAGNGALFVNPDNIYEIRDGILKIIEDDNLRKTIIENGYRNIERFNPVIMARQYINLYKEIT